MPKKLYLGGLQRMLFLKTIALIDSHFTVLALDHGHDYRQSQPKKEVRYFFPLDQKAAAHLQEQWLLGTHNAAIKPVVIQVNRRSLSALAQSQDSIWFDFATLCMNPVGADDYWALATRYPIFFLSGVPQLSDKRMDELWRFIKLIDVLHEHNVRWFISAKVPLAQLYAGRKLNHRFVRTLSRLSLHGMLEPAVARVTRRAKKSKP
jgi:cell division protein ZapE